MLIIFVIHKWKRCQKHYMLRCFPKHTLYIKSKNIFVYTELENIKYIYAGPQDIKK